MMQLTPAVPVNLVADLVHVVSCDYDGGNQVLKITVDAVDTVNFGNSQRVIWLSHEAFETFFVPAAAEPNVSLMTAFRNAVVAAVTDRLGLVNPQVSSG